MIRYIDADILKDKTTRVNNIWNGTTNAEGKGLDEIIDDIPTADVRENVKGEWIKEIKHHKDDEQEYDYYDIYCSACGGKPEKAWHLTDYCPNCGAQMMRGEANE